MDLFSITPTSSSDVLPSSSSRPTPSVIIDALPYIDTEYEEEGMKEMVTHLIQAEANRQPKPTPSESSTAEKTPDIDRFTTPLMQHTYEQLQNRVPPEVLSMKRYELPPPPSGKLTDLGAWGECVDNSFAQLEHQRVRIQNLELMLDYSTEGWKSYLEILTRMVGQAQGQLAGIRKQIQETNWSRKTAQTSTGDKLRQLESSWVGLVSKNYEIERACLEVERMVGELRIEVAREKAMGVNSDGDTNGGV